MRKSEQQREAMFLKRLSSFRQEITAMAVFDIHPLLITLRRQGHKIAVLAGKRDTAFPLKRMKRHLQMGINTYNLQTEQDKKHYGLDVFTTKAGGHELYTNTHEIMEQVIALLELLEADNAIWNLVTSSTMVQ